MLALFLKYYAGILLSSIVRYNNVLLLLKSAASALYRVVLELLAKSLPLTNVTMRQVEIKFSGLFNPAVLRSVFKPRAVDLRAHDVIVGP